MQQEKLTISEFRDRSLLVTKIMLGAIFVGILLYFSMQLLLMLFAALLIAVLFRGLAELISEKTPLSIGWSLGLVLLIFLALFAGFILYIAPQVSQQVEQLSSSIPKAVGTVKSFLQQYSWGDRLLENLRFKSFVEGGALGKATGAITGVFNYFIQGLIILMAGAYLAVTPKLYKNGILHLFPQSRRQRLSEVMDKLVYTLKRWLVGRFVDMLFIGALTWIGLLILGIPLALTLGLMAAIATYIPNFGPILALVPAFLVTLGGDPSNLIWIFALYMGVQGLENFIVLPLIQQKAVHLPPVLTISAQVTLGTAFGALGVLVATPLVAVAMVLVQELYVKDVLKDYSVG